MNSLMAAALARLADERTLAFGQVAVPDPNAFAVRVTRCNGRIVYGVPLRGGTEIEIRPLSNGSVRAGDLGVAIAQGGIYRGIFRGRM